MKKRPSSPIKKTLRTITTLIVQCCDPDEIILFGSYAKENQDNHSDLDILVIGDFRDSKYLRNAEVAGLLEQLPVKVDLHLMTPKEMAEAAREPLGFPGSVRSKGVRLYWREEVDRSAS